ncbi:MAG TPA: SCO family protein [Longimicrobium sp.]|jgi:protein SCO1/2|uniref:SCO family protein n=1 Tax=Longimicrobium sp. TaxID=2029185 RepID=UPI002EDABC1C
MRTPLRPLLAIVLVALAACGRTSAPIAPPSADAPSAAADLSPADFSVYDLEARWRDQEGRDRGLASLRGKTQVVAMVYTTCTHTCPAIVAELKRLEAALPAGERAKVGFVLVSLDPARDTPAQLKAFATSMRLDPAAWTLLTGGEDAVRELAAVLGIRYRAETDAQISHSNTYLVLDTAGRMVHRQDGVGSGTGPALARIRAAAR